MRTQANLLMRLSPCVDCCILAMALAAVWSPSPRRWAPDLIIVLLLIPFLSFLLRFFGMYESQRVERTWDLVRKLLSVQLTGLLFAILVLLALNQRRRIRELALFFAVSTFTLMLERMILYSLLHALRSRGFDKRNVCIIGNWETAVEMDQRFGRHPEWGLQVSCVGLGPLQERQYFSYADRAPISASLEDVLRTKVIDEVLIAVRTEELPRENPTVVLCEQHGVLGRVLLPSPAAGMTPTRLQGFCDEATITVGVVPSDGKAGVVKRVNDISLGAFLLILVSPLMLLTGLLVRLSSPGPIFFRQPRAGLHGRPFVMYKFRTMFKDAEAMLHALAHRSVTKGPIFKDPVDCRITQIGRVLRRFSLDELPQLFNVIRGDMSLVGPRPLPVHEAARISGLHRRRFSMRPGITCLWQVNGRSDVGYTQWMNYDLQYVDRWSLWLDTKLLLRTIPAVLSGRGAY